MTSTARLDSNRRNALRSTGPRTAAGKARSATNALATGLYARLAVVPALGETPEGWESFADGVARDLGADGPVELALAEQAASLLWRLRRVRAVEGVAFSPAGLALPPDPDQVTADDEDPYFDLPPNAPPARRLAYARARLRTRRASLWRAEVGVAVLTGTGAAEDCDWLVADGVAAAVGEELGWGASRPLEAAARGQGEEPERVAWTAEFTRKAVAVAGAAHDRDPEEFAAAVASRLTERAQEIAASIGRLEVEEQELATGLAADRARAAVAAALADEGLLARVAKTEAHLGRELERVLGLLDRVRVARTHGSAAPAAGFVPPAPAVAGCGNERRVLPLRPAE